jgi:hypothetical protein
MGCRIWALGAVVVLTVCVGGCAAPPGARLVAEQNTRNVDAWSANTRRMGEALRSLAAHQAAVDRQRAREFVASGLTSVRTSLPLDEPSMAELTGDGAPWTIELARRAAALRERLDAVPLEERSIAADELAGEYPVVVDIAAGGPGFTPARVLGDSVELERLNRAIDGETAGAVRRAYVDARNALLDAYRPARLAGEDARRALERIERYAGVAQEQAAAGRVHARGLLAAVSAPDPRAVAGDARLYELLVDLIERERGPDAARELDELLNDLLAGGPAGNDHEGGVR